MAEIGLVEKFAADLELLNKGRGLTVVCSP